MRKTTVFQWIFVGTVTLFLGIPFTIAGYLQTGLPRKGRMFRRLSKIYSRVLFFAFRVRVVPRGIERIDSRQGYRLLELTHSIYYPAKSSR